MLPRHYISLNRFFLQTRERTERGKKSTIAWFSACYYLLNIINAKYVEKMPTQTVYLVDELRKFREVNPEIENCALAVVGCHLEPVSGDLVLLGIADTSLPDEYREQM